jgi:hypothetical protein
MMPSKECAMSQSSKVSPEQFAQSVRDEMEKVAKQVMEAVNEAPDGEWIAGSEEKVRDITAELRRRLFEQAVQKRVDAAEAAFPPSARSGDGKTAGG